MSEITDHWDGLCFLWKKFAYPVLLQRNYPFSLSGHSKPIKMFTGCPAAPCATCVAGVAAFVCLSTTLSLCGWIAPVNWMLLLLAAAAAAIILEQLTNRKSWAEWLADVIFDVLIGSVADALSNKQQNSG